MTFSEQALGTLALLEPCRRCAHSREDHSSAQNVSGSRGRYGCNHRLGCECTTTQLWWELSQWGAGGAGDAEADRHVPGVQTSVEGSLQAQEQRLLVLG